MKHRLSRPVVCVSDKEQRIVRQLKDKLHYDCQDVPLPPIDPDGWPLVMEEVDPFEDEELPERAEP
jgi:hypothetical protein